MRFCPRCGSRYEHERFCPEDGVPTEPLPDSGPSHDALIGSVVDGRYRVEAQIGEGGMGVVYKATHVSLNKALALKVLRGEMAKDAEVVQRFIQEAQAATSIGQENIIDISDFGRLADGTVYFVMEFLDGAPLNDIIKRGGSIPVSEALQIIRQIAAALGAAHQRGIVHRDLKPDNVFVVKRGELGNFVKVLDFGIAKVGGASNKLTRTGMVFGTPHYMSPEQAAGQSVDQRTDIYALGVIMYEMFTGRVPFDADTFMAVLTKHMFEQPSPMSDPASGRTLGALEEITLKALEKKPEHRYQTMQELVDDLERVSGGQRPQFAAAAAKANAALADALEPRSHSEMRLEDQLAAASSGGAGRKRLVLGAAVAALVLVGTVLAVALSGGKDDASGARLAPPPPAPPPIATDVNVPKDPEPSPEGAGEEPPTAEPIIEVVVVDSDPSGVTVVMDGAIVGSTPVRLPRPRSGQRSLELRHDGYQRQRVDIDAQSPAVLRVTLRKRVAPAKVVAKPSSVAPAPKPSASRKTPQKASEVVDPWAN